MFLVGVRFPENQQWPPRNGLLHIQIRAPTNSLPRSTSFSTALRHHSNGINLRVKGLTRHLKHTGSFASVHEAFRLNHLITRESSHLPSIEGNEPQKGKRN